MSEHVREIRFSVYVDTTKATYEESFKTLYDLLGYVQDLVDIGVLSSDLEEVRSQRFNSSDQPEA